MLVCTCARQWNMDTCTLCYESHFMCWGVRGWRQPPTGPRAGRRNPPSAATPLQASAPGLWCRPQARLPSPGSGTKISFSWSAMEMQREWKSIAREFGAPVKNRRRTNADMLRWAVRREGKDEPMRTPTEHQDTPWTPEESRHWILLLPHTHMHTHTYTVQRSDSLLATCFHFAPNTSSKKMTSRPFLSCGDIVYHPICWVIFSSNHHWVKN